MRPLKHLVILLSLMMYCVGVHAACNSVNSAGPFAIASDDASREFMCVLFGAFDPSLVKFTEAKTLGQMFKILSQAILSVGLMVMAYVVFAGVARTAMSGKFLGERGSTWTPLRVVAGIILLMPRGIGDTGYIMIQSIFMWIIYAGIGAGDMVWSSAATALATTSVYTAGHSTPLTPDPGTVISKVSRTANSVMQGTLCTIASNSTETFLDAQGNEMHIIPRTDAGNPTSEPGLSPLSTTLLYTTMNSNYEWPTSVLNAVNTIQVTYNNREWQWYTYALVLNGQLPSQNTLSFGHLYRQGGGSQAVNYNDCGYILGIGLQYKYYPRFIETVSPVLRTVMRRYQNNPTDIAAATTLTDQDNQTLQQAMTLLGNCLQDPNYSDDCNPSAATPGSSSGASKKGWMSAGFYYSKMATTGLGGAPSPKLAIADLNYTRPSKATVGNIPISTLADMTNRIISNIAKNSGGGNTNNPLERMYDDARSNMYKPGGSANKWIAIVLNPLMSMVSQSIVADMSDVFRSSGDPFEKAVGVGNGLLVGSFLIILVAMTTIFVTSTAANFCQGEEPVGEATNAVLQYIALMTLGLSGVMFAEGALLAVFLPLVPIVIWTIGVIGWFFAVFEAMAAAPIVALGVMWPESQNEVFGRGEPALMLLLNIFLRPALLVIGLLMGMLVCRITFSLAGLALAIASSLSAPIIRPDLYFGWIAVGFMFAYALLTIAQKAFGLIHDLPDKVLVYIGGQITPWGGSEGGVSALKTGVQRSGSGVNKNSGQALSQDLGGPAKGQTDNVTT